VSPTLPSLLESAAMLRDHPIPGQTSSRARSSAEGVKAVQRSRDDDDDDEDQKLGDKSDEVVRSPLVRQRATGHLDFPIFPRLSP